MEVCGLKVYPASYVSTKKYGDCKALSVFMQSLLSASGIPSFGVDVNGGAAHSKVQHDVPGPQFNHMILCVPLGADTIWLENTSNYLPSGYLGTFTQDKVALLVNGGESRLIRTPRMTNDQVLCRREYRYNVDRDGSAIVTSNWDLGGDQFEQFRFLKRNQSDEKLKETLEGMLGSNEHLEEWSISQKDRETARVQLSLKIRSTQSLRPIGTTRIVQQRYFTFPDLETPSNRKQPVEILLPFIEELVMEYDLSKLGNVLVSIPKPVQLTGEFGTYTVAFHHENSVVRVERSLRLSIGSYSLGQYPAFYQFIQSIKEADRKAVVTLEPNP